MTFSSRVRYLIQRATGFDVRHFDAMNAPLVRRMKLIERVGATVVFDVGANEGHYGAQLRRYGYRGRIVSFEPLAREFGLLAQKASTDPAWEAVNVALGATPGEATIHIGNFRQCSSLLPLVPSYAPRDTASQQVADETIRVDTLDRMAETYAGASDVLFVKADVQGFEQQVLDGARATMPRIDGFQLEMSFEPVYEGAPLFPQLVQRMDELGYTLRSFEPANCSPSGGLIQADGIFIRTSIAL
jgi:FkbM family methyltransferase